MALAIVFFTVASVLQFTLGAWVAQGRINLKESFRTPLIYAVVLSVLIILNGVEAPRWFTNTITLIGNLTIPLMLLALGVSLARLKISSFIQSLTLSLFRLAVGFSVGLGISFLLDLEGTLRGVLILQSSLSPAVYNYLFAERFGSAGGEVAGVIVLSTFLTFLLLPAVLVFLL